MPAEALAQPENRPQFRQMSASVSRSAGTSLRARAMPSADAARENAIEAYLQRHQTWYVGFRVMKGSLYVMRDSCQHEQMSHVLPVTVV